MKNLIIGTIGLLAFSTSQSVANSRMDFSVKILKQEPLGCSINVNLKTPKNNEFVFNRMQTQVALLFSDRSTVIEVFDPKNILTSCTKSGDWGKYSDYIPADGKSYITVGGNCAARTSGEVYFSFTDGFYSIDKGTKSMKLVTATLEQAKNGESDTKHLENFNFGPVSFPDGKECMRVIYE